MAKKIRLTIFLLIIYCIIFWFGFRFGEVYSRKKEKIGIEHPPETLLQKFIIVEKCNFGNYTETTFSEVNRSNLIIKLFFSRNLKHLLKLRDIQIYSADGKRLY